MTHDYFPGSLLLASLLSFYLATLLYEDHLSGGGVFIVSLFSVVFIVFIVRWPSVHVDALNAGRGCNNKFCGGCLSFWSKS